MDSTCLAQLLPLLVLLVLDCAQQQIDLSDNYLGQGTRACGAAGAGACTSLGRVWRVADPGVDSLKGRVWRKRSRSGLRDHGARLGRGHGPGSLGKSDAAVLGGCGTEQKLPGSRAGQGRDTRTRSGLGARNGKWRGPREDLSIVNRVGRDLTSADVISPAADGCWGRGAEGQRSNCRRVVINYQFPKGWRKLRMICVVRRWPFSTAGTCEVERENRHGPCHLGKQLVGLREALGWV